MIRYALLLALVFLILGLLRIARPLFSGAGRRRTVFRREAGEMVRDPVCGTWIDRRLALTVARPGGAAVTVCSESCRKRLEAG